MKPTKEELVELIGIAELLEKRLEEDMIWISASWQAHSIASQLRNKLNEICGEEYLESLRNPDK